MILKRATKIKGAGILNHLDGSNLTSPDLDFKNINLLFGWNGTGKTTLSRVLRCYELGEICLKLKKHTALEVSFQLKDGSTLSEADFIKKQNIRVFNRDFIDENIFQNIKEDGEKVKPLFYLGKTKIELIKEREDRDQKIAQEKETTKLVQDELRERDRFAKDTAKVIKDSLLGIKEFQHYDISDFIKRFEDIEKKIVKGETSLIQLQLSAQDFDAKLHTVKNFEALKVWVEDIKSGSSKLNSIYLDSTDEILKKTVSLQKTIERLRNDWVLSGWVQKGLEIYKERKSPNCEFCGQTLPEGKIAELEQHFNRDFTELSLKVDQKIEELKAMKLQEVAKIPDESTKKLAESFNQLLEKIIKKIESKQKNLLLVVDFSIEEKEKLIEEAVEVYTSADQVSASVVGAAKELEVCLVANNFEAFAEKVAKYKAEETKKDQLSIELRALDEKIKTTETDIKDFNLPAEQINKDLEKFLGHAELSFEGKTDEHGEASYEIKRNGENAFNLSEGEKTAISLIYFLRKLNEDGFDPKSSLIFIDDPISSMDSQFLYAAYAFIVAAIEDDSAQLKVGQFFLSTHNYDFLNLFKKKYWRDKTPRRCEAYMLRMKIDSTGKRTSNIYELDKLLKNYDSDYQYLFSQLSGFEKATESERNDLIRIYPYPNLARRVLETFLSFKFPNKTDLQAKVNAIKAPTITKDIKESVYRFINIQSHGSIKEAEGFSPVLLEPTAKDNILNVIKILKEEDFGHYEEMENSIR